MEQKINSIDWNNPKNKTGLIPTIVQSETTGRILGQVYSNRESLTRAIDKQRVIIKSRSQEHTDELRDKSPSRTKSVRLLSVVTDCDSDALLMKVQERGRFCHVPENHSCFNRVIWQVPANQTKIRIGYCAGRQETPTFQFLSALGIDVYKHYAPRNTRILLDVKDVLHPKIELIACKPGDVQFHLDQGHLDIIMCYQDNLTLGKDWQNWTSSGEKSKFVPAPIRLVAVKKKDSKLSKFPIIYSEAPFHMNDIVSKWIVCQGWVQDDKHYIVRHGRSEEFVRDGFADVALVIMETGRSIQANDLEIIGEVYTTEFAIHLSNDAYRRFPRFFRKIKHILDSNKTIWFYSVDDLEYGYLSNLYPAPFVDENGTRFPNSEQYYHCAKFPRDSKEYKMILACKTPFEAYTKTYEIGHGHFLHSENGNSQTMQWWVDARDQVMRNALVMKFDQNPKLREKLISTWPKRLIEHSRNDYHFGYGLDGTGANILGEMLMGLRAHYMESLLKSNL